MRTAGHSSGCAAPCQARSRALMRKPSRRRPWLCKLRTLPSRREQMTTAAAAQLVLGRRPAPSQWPRWRDAIDRTFPALDAGEHSRQGRARAGTPEGGPLRDTKAHGNAIPCCWPCERLSHGAPCKPDRVTGAKHRRREPSVDMAHGQASPATPSRRQSEHYQNNLTRRPRAAGGRRDDCYHRSMSLGRSSSSSLLGLLSLAPSSRRGRFPFRSPYSRFSTKSRPRRCASRPSGAPHALSAASAARGSSVTYSSYACLSPWPRSVEVDCSLYQSLSKET
ncbi:hypothetical protein FA09DRAFT_270625 [Tilletiopsis washingtonensis]|uniref:Uncharacterized protein n=1 Tax=Tilletiopsis washingtonensis TaxID=58919 RepID=A0A316ZCE8_9BASI|nr:hypothetical protein FA09DRAFT_270625 [Tilletiopsis washingtonensis]PWN98602.1 hypothetical protein FA09DRAFT_270625 [Tilletiopsis washingtonensis]